MKNFNDLEIYNLFMQYKNGSEKAYTKIVIMYLEYVERIVDTFFNDYNIEKEDLMSLGKIYLIDALNRYDVDSEIIFNEYIYNYVKNHIERYINFDLKKQNNSNKVLNDFYYDMGIINVDNNVNLYDSLIVYIIDLEKNYEKKELYNRINQIMNSLSDFEQQLLKMIFGFDNEEPIKIKDIVERDGIIDEFTYTYLSKKVIDLLYIIGRQLQNEGYTTDKIRINRRKRF